VGRTWPVDGRVIGIVVDADLDTDQLAGVRAAREAIDAAGLVPMIVAPRGGPIDRDQTLPAQRSLVTARSVEFDALLLAGAPARSALTRVNLDAKAGANTEDAAVDPRVQLLVDEAFRHGKAIAAWGAAAEVLPALGAPLGAPGVVTGPDVTATVNGLLAAMGQHRSWDRF
jgi:catalase